LHSLTPSQPIFYWFE